MIDVYKRQVYIKKEKYVDFLNCGDKVAVRGLLEEIPLPVNLGQFNERAVSYTHLDVYKRQV